GENHDVRLVRLEEPDAHGARAYAEGVEAGPGDCRHGRRLLGGDVADRAGQSLDQKLDEGLEMMPVLVAFRVEDDIAIARGKVLEASVAAPVLPEVHGPSPRPSRSRSAPPALRTRRSAADARYSSATVSPSAVPRGSPRYLPLTKPTM